MPISPPGTIPCAVLSGDVTTHEASSKLNVFRWKIILQRLRSVTVFLSGYGEQMGGERRGARRRTGGPWVVGAVVAGVAFGIPIAGTIDDRVGNLWALVAVIFIGLAAGGIGAVLQRRADRKRGV